MLSTENIWQPRLTTRLETRVTHDKQNDGQRTYPGCADACAMSRSAELVKPKPQGSRGEGAKIERKSKLQMVLAKFPVNQPFFSMIRSPLNRISTGSRAGLRLFPFELGVAALDQPNIKRFHGSPQDFKRPQEYDRNFGTQ